MRTACLPCALLLGVFACDDGAGEPRDAALDAAATPAGWLTDVDQPLPEWLSDTGLYGDLVERSPGAGVARYTPPHGLWSSGADKERLLYVPAGAAVDTGGEGYDFPVGTVLVKTFAFDGLVGREGSVAVESRLLFRRADGWDYGLYHWGADGREARLVEGNWGPQKLRLERAGGDAFEYTLPGRLDCRSCHETSHDVPVLGLRALNLDPALEDRADLFHPPAEAVAVEGRGEAEQAVMSYLVGNCVHCHHGRASGSDNGSYSLLPEDLVANVVNQPTESSASGSGIRVIPGNPLGSALYEAVVLTRRPGYDGDFKPMPPLGIDLPDPEAERALSEWIRDL